MPFSLSDPRHRLHSTFLKVIRAQEHFESLQVKLLAFNYGECQIVPEKNGDFGILRMNIAPNLTILRI